MFNSFSPVANTIKLFGVSDLVFMSTTALAAALAAAGGLFLGHQLPLNVPVPEEAPAPTWLEPECPACEGPAFECGEAPLLLQLPLQVLLIGVLAIFVLGLCVGGCCCERLCAFPQPRERYGKSVVRRAASRHAIAG